jgi:hypothetical protein
VLNYKHQRGAGKHKGKYNGKFISKKMENKMKPSDLTSTFPTGSIARKWECEMIAANIAVILERMGDEFKTITFNEYKCERLKDGNFSEKESTHFDKVIDYFKSSDTAALFSPAWRPR